MSAEAKIAARLPTILGRTARVGLAEEAKMTAKLPTILRSSRAGLAKIATGVKSAVPRTVGVVKQAVKSPVGKVAIGALAVGGAIGLGSYLALSGFGAGQSYAQYATDQALAGQPPPGAPLLPWGQNFLAQPSPDQGLVPYGYEYGYGYGYGDRLAAFFTSPFVLFILLLFVLGIVLIYVWRKTGK
jgi:hypothetical protein